MSERKRPPKDWEGAVDQAIREAFERGDFEHLPGKGKPLDLEDNPYTPADLRLAFKMLKDAGATPDWIEEAKLIRSERDAIAAWLGPEVRRQRKRASQSKTLSPDMIVAEYKELQALRENTCARFRERAGELNRLIDNYNLKVPIGRLQRLRIPIDQAIDQFLAECTKK